MLPKKNRVDKKLVDQIFKEGRFINSPGLTFKFIKTNSSLVAKKPLLSRVSFIVPKSVAKLAVTRNFLRRRGYSALEKHLSQFPAGLRGVFVFKKPLKSVAEIGNEIKTILNKIN